MGGKKGERVREWEGGIVKSNYAIKSNCVSVNVWTTYMRHGSQVAQLPVTLLCCIIQLIIGHERRISFAVSILHSAQYIIFTYNIQYNTNYTHSKALGLLSYSYMQKV